MNRFALAVLGAVLAIAYAAPRAHGGWWDSFKKKARAAVSAVKKKARSAVTAVKKSARKAAKSIRSSRWFKRLRGAGRRAARKLKRGLSRIAQRLLAGPAPRGGRKKGTALVVCIENANKSPFMDRTLEAVAALQMRRFAVRYEKSAILRNCDIKSFKGALRRFKGLRTDIATLVHGSKTYLLLDGNWGLFDYEIRRLKSEGLNLGVVFQLNCWGSHLNEAWLAAGAKAVTGSRKSNSRVQAYVTFFRAWTGGKSFRQAVHAANTRSNLIQKVNTILEKPMKKLAAACCGSSATKTICGKLGPAKIRGAFCSHYNRTTADIDSTFLVGGDGNLKF